MYQGSIIDLCDKIIATGSAIEASAYTKDKIAITLRLNVSALPGSNKQYILSCSDITQEKSQELQLQRAQKMDALGKMTGGICHDFNNILGIISGYASLLESADRNDGQCENYISQILKASERGADLSRKLLSFSGKKINDSQVVCVNELLEQDEQMLSRVLTPLVNIEMDLESDLWPVFVNSSDLEDAILNMCINAGHAMLGGGSLLILTRNVLLTEAEAFSLDINAGNYVLLSIKDSGMGMDENTLSSVFDPFFSTKEEGTGLGLSQTYNFVRGAEGGITVTSEVNNGTEFLIYLPRDYRKKEEHSLPENHMLVPFKTNAAYILVVDDEPALRDIRSRQLSKYGHVVYSAGNGLEALKILASKRVEIVISDIVMPEMDGWDLSRAVKDSYPDVIMQLVTGYGEGFERNQRNLDRGLLSTVLHKPLSEKALKERVENLLYIKSLSCKKAPRVIQE